MKTLTDTSQSDCSAALPLSDTHCILYFRECQYKKENRNEKKKDPAQIPSLIWLCVAVADSPVFSLPTLTGTHPCATIWASERENKLTIIFLSVIL